MAKVAANHRSCNAPIGPLVCVEQGDDIAGLSDDGRGPLLDEFVRAIADGAGHGTGHRTDAPAEAVSGER